MRAVDFDEGVREWRAASLLRVDKGVGESSSVAAEGAGGLDRRTWRDIVPVYDHPVRPFAEWGMALKLTTLGPGFDLATTLLRGLNLRGSANFIDFGATIVDEGVNYFGDIHLRSGQVNVDWFPRHGGFHISPGVLIFDHRIQGGIYVPGGQTYTLEDETFTSSAANPITGLASLKYERKIAPSLMIGFANLIPRSGKRLTVPVEFGVAYVGRSSVNIALTGTACQPDGCFDVSTDPGSQQNLQEELNDINEDLRRVQFYPLLSIGVGYRF